MVAAARCLVQPHFSLESILRAVLRDEFIAWRKVRNIDRLAVETHNAHVYPTQKYEEVSHSNGPVSIADVENETVVKLVDSGVTAILTRLQSKLHNCTFLCHLGDLYLSLHFSRSC